MTFSDLNTPLLIK